jgi:hypothetical protein
MDIDQLEALALGDDREAALAALVPGSEDHDTWRAIALQHQGALDEVDRMLTSWPSRHGDTPARRHLERRQLLLRVGADLDGHAKRLVDAAHLALAHEAEIEARAARYPSRLDDANLALGPVLADALAAGRTLEHVTAAGLPALTTRALDPAARRALLERLDRTGLPGLVEHVAADLGDRSSRGFGSLALHGRLTLDELDELARRRPAVRGERAWVDAVLARLAPSPEVDLAIDLAARAAYLDRLSALVAPLPPSMNALKVHVLFHRLDLDRRTGQLDRGRLLAYLALPRRAGYVRAAWLERFDRGEVVGLDGAAVATRLPPVTDDEPLVRAYLGRFLVDEEPAAFAPHVDVDWLERLQAEVRLLAGAADADRWTHRLGAAAAAALRDRVDLELSPTNPPRFAAGARVFLDVAIKRVTTLRIRVFRIDPLAYFHARGGEVDSTIDLDGLAAGWEEVRTLDAPAMVRREHRLELATCDRPGTYVVELIGGGRASRALVKKGGLRAIGLPSPAGLSVEIFDDEGRPRPDAAVWLGGREHRRRGGPPALFLPFSTRPGPTAVMLVDGELTSVTTLELPAETPRLTAAVLLDRQALVPGRDATALVRVTLTVGAGSVPLSLLQDPYVELVSIDRAGVPARRRQPVTIADDRDLELAIPVAADLARLELTVGGRYRSLSEQRTINLSAPWSIDVGTLHAGPVTEALYLTWTTDGYRLSLLGKSGEPRAGRAIALSLTHWASTRSHDVTLATDERGAIELGPLDGITGFTAAAAASEQAFDLGAPRPRHPTELVQLAGEDLALLAPAGIARGGAAGLDWYVVELRGDLAVRHVGERFAADGDRLRADRLEPGTYRVVVRGQPPVTVRLLDAVDLDDGHLTAATASGLHEWGFARAAIADVTVDDEAITITIADADDDLRAHVVATPFVPAPAWSADLGAPIRNPATRWTPPPRAAYVSGRDIGDEYRYVLDRQQAPRRPGTMLERPGLLLNPWSLRATATATQDARPQAAWAAPPAPAPAMGAAYADAMMQSRAAPRDPAFAPHDFLADPPVVLANLRPDDAGVIRVARAALGGAQVVRVVCVDPRSTSVRTLPLPPRPLAVRDLRLPAALPADRHLREDRRLVALPAGATLTVGDRATSRVELVDTVEKLYRALCALSGDATLAAWDFLPRWHALPREEKLRLYSQHACHELAVFIRWKDPALFADAIRPYLASKLHPTFVDRALLDEDLTPYLASWRLQRLNGFERALLAIRVPAARAALARNLADDVDLVPPDPAGDDRLVDTLLAGGALAGDGTDLAVADEAEEAAKLDSDLLGDTRQSGAGGGGGAGAPGGPPATRGLTREAPAKMKKGGRRRDDDGRAAELAERTVAAPMYRAADRTEELAEHNWWHQRVSSSPLELRQLVPPRRLWRDLAAHADGGPFLSPHLADAATGFAACVCALAVIDLPFTAAPHALAARGDGASVTAGSHALAAVAELAAVAGPPTGEVLVGQSYFRQDDRWEWDGAVQREKSVTGELLAGIVYQCQVVVTNPTSRVRRLAVLTQIPAGALPATNGRATRTTRVELAAYATSRLEYAFYFPAAGDVEHYGAQIVDGDVLVGAAASRLLAVVAVPSEVDAASWPHVSQRGTTDDVVAFLTAANLGRVDLARAAWRMRDRDAFTRITAALAARHTHDATLWAYAFLHGDRARAAEWLAHADDFTAVAGPLLDGGPIDPDPIARARYQHLEYAPLVNARAHRLGDRRTILNDGLAAQWRAFLELVALHHRPRAEHWLAAAHYLFTMDRPDDALRALARADAELAPASAPGPLALQRDYLAAYAAAASGDLAAARARVGPHLAHPVDRWRHRFGAVAAMLAELEGAGPAPAQSPDSRAQRMDELAARQPTLAVRVEGGAIVIDATLLAAVSLRYYRMDIELLFSRQPFLGAAGDRFSFIEPGRVDDVALAAGTTRLPLPAELAAQNVVIEAVAGPLRAAVTHFAHDLAVAVAAPYGQLQVRRASTGAPLPATYVKCYARMRGGAVAFYKDGYTDLRGRLDYATLSTDDLDRVERFALLVAHDTAGATVLEAAPPPR